jgi:FtsH-binding integral membrane protein
MLLVSLISNSTMWGLISEQKRETEYVCLCVCVCVCVCVRERERNLSAEKRAFIFLIFAFLRSGYLGPHMLYIAE